MSTCRLVVIFRSKIGTNPALPVRCEMLLVCLPHIQTDLNGIQKPTILPLRYRSKTVELF